MSKRTRSRTGCHTCRKSGYKCDEGRPKCGRCARLLYDECSYGPLIRWRKIQTIRRNETGFPEALKDEESHGVISAISNVNGNLDNLSHETKPVSGICFRGQNSSKAFSSRMPCTILSESSNLSKEFDSGDCQLLHHWAEALSPLLSVASRSRSNPFLVHMTAMAFHEGPLKHTILSLAARHLANLAPHQQWSKAVQKHQHIAIKTLREALSDPVQAFSDSTLAAVLLMQVGSVLSDDDEPRANHLYGARSIILKRGMPSTQSPSSCSTFLLSLYAYHDVLSSVSRGERPLLDDEYLQSVELDPLLGCTSSIILMVSQISHLHSQKKRMANEIDEAIMKMGSSIEKNLRAWRAPVAEADLVHTAEACRHAALIYLYRVLYDVGAPHPTTLRHARSCLDALMQVPPNSPSACIHVWPLFTAGCETMDLLDRKLICQRFDDMYLERKIFSLKRARKAMEDVWLSKEREAIKGVDKMCRLDCIDVIKRKGTAIEMV